MDVKVSDIKCTKCNQGIFQGVAYEEKCDFCGESISNELILAYIQNVNEELKK